MESAPLVALVTLELPVKSTLPRSIGAVAAAFVSVIVATTLIDVILHATNVFPPWGERMSDSLFGLALAYRLVLDTAGAALTARLAPSKPMLHALIVGAIGTVLALVAALAMGDQGPAWYAYGLAASSVPTAWLGALLARRREPA